MEENANRALVRIVTMLKTALGEDIANLLLDDSVIEIMVNENGALWVDFLGKGREFSGVTLTPEDCERVIFIVASSVKDSCNSDSPIISAELPESGARFQGILPPLVVNPVFTIRKKAIKVFSLEDYVDEEILTKRQADDIRELVTQKKNILIAGGTGSGKTTLANAILKEISKSEDRLVIIEDTKELQCEARDYVSLRTKDGLASMRDLLKATLRLRPDRIIIGEVRGAEALELLKAWNTGHPGGCATVHADSATKALTRLEQLVQEAGVLPCRELIEEAIDAVIYIEKVGSGRKVKEIVSI